MDGVLVASALDGTDIPAGYVEECEAVIRYLSELLHDVRYDRNEWRERVLDFSNNGVKLMEKPKHG